MKIVLKKDWDLPIGPPIGETRAEGYFAGRETELNQLVNEILRRKRGAILISGYPGVGKTSLVYKALSEAKEKNRNIISVLYNAAQLKVESKENKIDPKKAMEILIRRLYSTTHDLSDEDLDKELRAEIETLYRKAVATEFKLVEAYQKQKDVSKEITKERVFELSYKGKIPIYLAFWFIAILSQYGYASRFPLLPDTLTSWLSNKIAPLLLVYPIPKGLNIAINAVLKKTRKIKEVAKTKEKAEEIYQIDNSITNLEFDLDKIHREISKSGMKLIYIIDELDKLNHEHVEELLGFFKNLFTLSEALFIIVAGERMYGIGAGKEEHSYRPKEYTYFTSRYFLSRPMWQELSAYLDDIIDKTEAQEDKLDILKRALCLGARNDFFDLKNLIKDRITSFSGNNLPVIELRDLSDDQQRARFHRAITVLFEEKYMSFSQSKWKENETLLRSLFEHAQKIYSSYSGTEHQDLETDNTETEMKRDFNSFLHRHGSLQEKSETMVSIRNLNIPIRTYIYTGSIPEELPSSLDELTEFETRFINEFQRYCEYIISLINGFRVANRESKISGDEFWRSPEPFLRQISTWGFEVLSQFNDNYPVRQHIVNQEHPGQYVREDIEERTEKIMHYTKTMLVHTNLIISNMLPELLPQLDLKVSGLQLPSLFIDTAQPIRNALHQPNPSVVYKGDHSKQILFTYEKMNAIEKVRKEIVNLSSTHRIVCVTEKKGWKSMKGLNIITVESPQKLENSLTKSLKDVQNFLLGDGKRVKK